MNPPDPDKTSTENRASAVALAYQRDDGVPRVVAKGHGLIAQEIIERAREAGVYVHESRELVALLMQVDLDQAIPSELYIAVAELLAWLYTLEQEGRAPPTPPLRGDIVRQTTKA
jgi:flagellar biosynthesis protein